MYSSEIFHGMMFIKLGDQITVPQCLLHIERAESNEKKELTTSVIDKTKRALAAVIGHIHTVKFESPKLSFRLFTKRVGK